MDPAAVPPGGELEPRERVDGRRVGLDAGDVAAGDAAGAAREQPADPLTEAGQILEGDRTTHGEVEDLRRTEGHHQLGPPARRKLIAVARQGRRRTKPESPRV